MMDPVGSTNLGGIHFELGRGFEGQLLSRRDVARVPPLSKTHFSTADKKSADQTRRLSALST